MVPANLPMSSAQIYGLSSFSAFLAFWIYGEKITIGITHVRRMRTALVLPGIMATLIGNTVATNLPTVMSTRLAIEIEYETYDTYNPSLHTNGDSDGSKTECLLLAYRAQLLTRKSTSETAMLVM